MSTLVNQQLMSIIFSNTEVVPFSPLRLTQYILYLLQSKDRIKTIESIQITDIFINIYILVFSSRKNFQLTVYKERKEKGASALT